MTNMYQDDEDGFFYVVNGMIRSRSNRPPKHARPSGWGDGEVYWHDEDGFIWHHPARTKYSHPYNYDPIVLFGGKIDKTDRTIDAVYSDRMQQWDYNKFDASLKAACGQGGELRFSWNSPDKVNALLQHYYDDPTIRAIKVVEMCNANSGYPLWLLYFRKGQKTKARKTKTTTK